MKHIAFTAFTVLCTGTSGYGLLCFSQNHTHASPLSMLTSTVVESASALPLPSDYHGTAAAAELQPRMFGMKGSSSRGAKGSSSGGAKGLSPHGGSGASENLAMKPLPSVPSSSSHSTPPPAAHPGTNSAAEPAAHPASHSPPAPASHSASQAVKPSAQPGGLSTSTTLERPHSAAQGAGAGSAQQVPEQTHSSGASGTSSQDAAQSKPMTDYEKQNLQYQQDTLAETKQHNKVMQGLGYGGAGVATAGMLGAIGYGANNV